MSLALLAIVAAACAPPSTNPDGSVPQRVPVGINGMIEETGAGVWGADLFGSQLVRFDPDTGSIAERYGPIEGLCGTDDVVVMGDGSLVATCPSTGLVIRVPARGHRSASPQCGNGCQSDRGGPLR